MDTVTRLDTRVTTLHHRSHTLKERSKKLRNRFTQAQLAFATELHALQHELALLDTEAGNTTQRIRTLVGQFTKVVKHGDLEQLKAKVNVWAPEKFVSRTAFHRMRK
ncbi:MAG: hypothetical protein OXR66_07175 [Candidatus Woesearchaeota archaeon]|nr:hypothetical protein [Candidatus Woesearchaeota archaeon]